MQILQLAVLFLALPGSLAVAIDRRLSVFGDATWSFYCHDGGFKLHDMKDPTPCMRFWNTCTDPRSKSEPKTLQKGDNFKFTTSDIAFSLELYKGENCTEFIGANKDDWEHVLDETVGSWRVAGYWTPGDPSEPKPGCL